MSGWTALNLEPEDLTAEEVDDTKEIQLEEAFKLYQNALKLHSQGPDYYEEAAAAYAELFASEVFKYPEALSDLHHDFDDLSISLLTAPESVAVVLPNGLAPEAAANSLPQLLYLANKAKAQFLIDVAHAKHKTVSNTQQAVKYYIQYCAESLTHSARALEKDDTDLDLWKKAARISETLGSARLQRFCLEGVLAGDDDDETQEIDLSGLDEAYAKGELESLVRLLQDDLSQGRDSNLRAKSALLDILKQSSDPFPFLPKMKNHLEYVDDVKRPLIFSPNETTILIPKADALTVTRALLQVVNGPGLSQSPSQSEGVIKLKIADDYTPSTDRVVAEVVDQVPSALDQVDRDSPASFHSAQDQPVEAAVEVSIFTQDTQPAEESVENTVEPEEVPPTLEAAEKSTQQTTLPSRKRSSTAAGNEEPEARVKSKRIRARESLIELNAHDEEVIHDPKVLYRDQIARLETADDDAFNSLNSILAQLDVLDVHCAKALRQTFAHPDTENGDFENGDSLRRHQYAMIDLRHALMSWDDARNSAFNTGHGAKGHVEKSTGLTLFLNHTKSTIQTEPDDMLRIEDYPIADFLRDVELSDLTLDELVLAWLQQLLTSVTEHDLPSAYLQTAWPSELKQAVTSIILTANEMIYRSFLRHIPLSTQSAANDKDTKATGIDIENATEFAQTMFELHLDNFSVATTPGSSTALTDRPLQLDRLHQWGQLASDLIQIQHGEETTVHEPTQIVIRHLWSSVLFNKLSDQVEKVHVLTCLKDIISFLEASDSPIVALPNNAAMPIISKDAAEQEITRINTLEFFLSVFDGDNSDPVAVIMKIEPILEPVDNEFLNDDGGVQEYVAQVSKFREFLAAGDPSLTLFLWRRLQNAYTTLPYSTKVFSCLLRSIETIVYELCSSRHLNQDQTAREISMLRWLRDVDDLMTKALAKVDDPKIFETIDVIHLNSSIDALQRVLSIVHQFVLLDDSLRVGLRAAPTFRNQTAAKAFEKAREKFRDMYVRTWVLIYVMLKEFGVQEPQSLKASETTLPELLHNVHEAIGPRQYCRQCNKLFLRQAKADLLDAASYEILSAETAQILFDLYQIRLAPGFGDADHGCQADSLDKDKRTAQSLVPIIMSFAKMWSIKDLLKGELRSTIEKIQTAMGPVKPLPALAQNRKAITAYLKSPINPRSLYNALKGIGEIMTRDVKEDTASIASQGWYLLLGNLTLAKYKSVKRVNPTPTDDLDTAASYLRQDLEHNSMEWESWFRLAQVFDAKIEDGLIWNSTKLNDSKSDLTTLEKNAIHAYTMATTLAMRSAGDDVGTFAKLDEMFFDFAVRLYSSSREPLNMDAFSTDKTVRYLSNISDSTMSKESQYKPMSEYAVWSFAARLLRRRFGSTKAHWLRSYTLGKCLWKMWVHSHKAGRSRKTSIAEIMEAFSDAVEEVPKKVKSGDPILEPHFKIVSVVHKLRERNEISSEQGVKYLQVTQYARNIHLADGDDGKPDWETYILAVLKRLQTADKSNWHHRIIARAAHVSYDNDPEPKTVGALGARHHFMQQIFTKTMTMQVWKPEYERPGRHYVYTGRYLRFFVDLLKKLRDRTNLEQVNKRIRRKTTDFIDHLKIWEYAVVAYVEVLRNIGKVQIGKERELFDNLTFDEFTRQSEKLEKWAHDPDNDPPMLDIMQDAIELKKLNNSYMKGTAIDDLIGDTYATLYDHYVKQLPEEERAPPANPGPPPGSFINMTTDTAPTGDDGLDRMRLNNLLTTQDGPTSLKAQEIIASSVGLDIQPPPIHTGGTPPPDTLKIPAPSKPGRAKTITRREVQKKAEAAIVKPPPIKTPTLTKRFIIDIPPTKRVNYDSDAAQDDDKGQETAGVSRATSRRGSLSARASADPDNNDEDENEDQGGDDEIQGDEGDAEDADDESDGEEENENDDDGDDNEDRDEDQKPTRRGPSFSKAVNQQPQASKMMQRDGADEDEEMQDVDDDGSSADEAVGSAVEIPDSQDKMKT